MGERNIFEETFYEAIAGVEATAAQVLERITETFAGRPETLRDGTEFDPLELPRDLYAHRNVQTEWWYYTGHGETTGGKEFGFELVFFKRRTDLDKFGPVPLRLIGNPIYFAHFAVTDHAGETFRYAHRKSANGAFDDPASASEDHYHLRLGDWSVRESGGSHVLRASIGSEIIFEASLKPTKPVVKNGRNLDGVSYKDEGQASRYFSYTRMALEGDIDLGRGIEHFHGNAWMDREFGTWTATDKQSGWDWFSIQLDDETELMAYQLRDRKNNVSDYSAAVFINKDGVAEFLGNEEFTITPKSYWKSERTGATYPTAWEINVPNRHVSLSVISVIPNQELDTRGSTMIVYWEGACKVSGVSNGISVSGKAYVELVGYDRSHENPNLAYFLMSNKFESTSNSK